MESGVIESFTVDISQETLGVGWAYAEIRTDQSEDREDLIQDICDHGSTNETFAVGSENYIAMAELPFPDGVYEYGKYLRGLEGVEMVDLSPARQLPSTQLQSTCKYTSRGKKVAFTKQQMEVLRYLVNDARISIQDLSEKTGYKAKRVRRILRELHECEDVHFTIRFNPSVEDDISFMLKVSFNEAEVEPGEIAYWIEKEFPQEYWLSFLLLSKPVMVNYMTSESLSRVESIIRRLKDTSFIQDVETLLIYHIEKPTKEGASISPYPVPPDGSLIPAIV